MRIGTTAVLAGALFAYATGAHAGLQLINNGSLSAKEAQAKFEAAWKACNDAQKTGAALTRCINQKLAPYKLQLSE